MDANEVQIQFPPLSRGAVETLVRMWGISLACLKQNAKVVAAATIELAVFCEQQAQIAESVGAKPPFEEVGDILHPFLKEMIEDVKTQIIQSGKDPEQILEEGRKRFGVDLNGEKLPPFEEDEPPSWM